MAAHEIPHATKLYKYMGSEAPLMRSGGSPSKRSPPLRDKVGLLSLKNL